MVIMAFAAALIVPVGLLGTVATAASASPPNLAAMLLKIGQMPTGWAVYSGSSNGLGCLANVLEPKSIKQTAKSGRRIRGRTELPRGHGEARDLQDRQDRLQEDRCQPHRLHTPERHHRRREVHRHGRADELSALRGRSKAFEASLTVEGMAYGETIVIVRKGNVVMDFEEADIPSVDVSQFQGFVEKAVAKLPP